MFLKRQSIPIELSVSCNCLLFLLFFFISCSVSMIFLCFSIFSFFFLSLFLCLLQLLLVREYVYRRRPLSSCFALPPLAPVGNATAANLPGIPTTGGCKLHRTASAKHSVTCPLCRAYKTDTGRQNLTAPSTPTGKRSPTKDTTRGLLASFCRLETSPWSSVVGWFEMRW